MLWAAAAAAFLPPLRPAVHRARRAAAVRASPLEDIELTRLFGRLAENVCCSAACRWPAPLSCATAAAGWVLWERHTSVRDAATGRNPPCGYRLEAQGALVGLSLVVASSNADVS